MDPSQSSHVNFVQRVLPFSSQGHLNSWSTLSHISHLHLEFGCQVHYNPKHSFYEQEILGTNYDHDHNVKSITSWINLDLKLLESDIYWFCVNIM